MGVGLRRRSAADHRAAYVDRAGGNQHLLGSGDLHGHANRDQLPRVDAGPAQDHRDASVRVQRGAGRELHHDTGADSRTVGVPGATTADGRPERHLRPDGEHEHRRSTTWSWVFDAGSPGTSTSSKPVVTFADARNHLVLVNATNCVGASAQFSKNVTIYPDVRHITPDFSWDANSPTTDNAITFTAVGRLRAREPHRLHLELRRQEPAAEPASRRSTATPAAGAIRSR